MTYMIKIIVKFTVLKGRTYPGASRHPPVKVWMGIFWRAISW